MFFQPTRFASNDVVQKTRSHRAGPQGLSLFHLCVGPMAATSPKPKAERRSDGNTVSRDNPLHSNLVGRRNLRMKSANQQRVHSATRMCHRPRTAAPDSCSPSNASPLRWKRAPPIAVPESCDRGAHLPREADGAGLVGSSCSHDQCGHNLAGRPGAWSQTPAHPRAMPPQVSSSSDRSPCSMPTTASSPSTAASSPQWEDRSGEDPSSPPSEGIASDNRRPASESRALGTEQTAVRQSCDHHHTPTNQGGGGNAQVPPKESASGSGPSFISQVARENPVCIAAGCHDHASYQLQQQIIVLGGPTSNTVTAPLLPPQSNVNLGKKTLVLDLDETLVHSSFKPVANYAFQVEVQIEDQQHQVFVSKRPGVEEFLQRVARCYEVVIFTASLEMYANPVIDLLDPQSLCSARLFRGSCTHVYFTRDGTLNYIKDLSKLGRDLRQVVIVDNSPIAYSFHRDHAIPIRSWFDDESDRELIELTAILEELSKVDDVPRVMREALPLPVGFAHAAV